MAFLSTSPPLVGEGLRSGHELSQRSNAILRQPSETSRSDGGRPWPCSRPCRRRPGPCHHSRQHLWPARDGTPFIDLTLPSGSGEAGDQAGRTSPRSARSAVLVARLALEGGSWMRGVLSEVAPLLRWCCERPPCRAAFARAATEPLFPLRFTFVWTICPLDESSGWSISADEQATGLPTIAPLRPAPLPTARYRPEHDGPS